MKILSKLKELIFGKKKIQEENGIDPQEFFQTLADYAQSLGFAITEGMYARMVQVNPNYVEKGIQFRIYGQVVAICLNSCIRGNKLTPGIYYTSGTKIGGFTGPFTITTLNMIKADLDMVSLQQKEIHQQLKLESINEDFV